MQASQGSSYPWAKCLHCVRTACILRTQRLGYSPKNTCHLFTSTAKQQSPHQNNKTAFSLVIKCRYEQANQPYKKQLCKGMQDAHMFKFWLGLVSIVLSYVRSCSQVHKVSVCAR